MFNLAREVSAWCAAVAAERCRPAEGAAELSDHLYCEIERGRAEGLSEEAAFRAATARLGAAPHLTAEFVKNRTALGAACKVAAKFDDPVAIPEHRRLLIVHAIVWAAFIIAASLLLKKTEGREVSSWLLIGVLIPLWLASDLIFRRALRHRPSGRA